MKDKIAMLTAYDYSMAGILAEAGVDMILVGDSLGMVILGYESTKFVTMEDMIRHGAAVVRGVRDSGGGSLVVVDMPFGTCDEVGVAVKNCKLMVEETGCEMVKIEGLPEVVKAVVESGVKVMAHTGLKPQTAERFVVQGGSREEREKIVGEAVALEEAGAGALVLECVPADLGREIADRLEISVIGIGAGVGCDGQVLVSYDVLGIYEKRLPKFVRKYADLKVGMGEAVSRFVKDVKSGRFPSDEESY